MFIRKKERHKMKANNGRGNIPDRDEWETPQRLFDKLNNQYHFSFDCCATKNNKKTKLFSDDFINWYTVNGISWMNPPFSMAWKMFNHFFKVVNKGVAVYRCDNLETGIWQNVILPKCSWIFIPNHRINYEGLDGMGSRFPSALIGLNVEPPKFIDGICLKNYKVSKCQENEQVK